MKQELTDKIIEKCPQLFANLKHIEASDGWYDLIRTTAICIEQELKNLPLELQGQVLAQQVKSKFGGLRFYISKSTPHILGIISMAEAFSYKLCEKCGAPASTNNDGGWIRTLCENHKKDDTK